MSLSPSPENRLVACPRAEYYECWSDNTIFGFFLLPFNPTKPAVFQSNWKLPNGLLFQQFWARLNCFSTVADQNTKKPTLEQPDNTTRGKRREKGTFYFLASVRGRPRGRRVNSRPMRSAVFFFQRLLPNGAPPSPSAWGKTTRWKWFHITHQARTRIGTRAQASCISSMNRWWSSPD